MQPRALLEQITAAGRLKDTMRHSFTAGGRQESVAEHSWRLALMALLLSEDYPALDMQKLLSMCLLHDIGEAFTGDIPAFEKTSVHAADERRAVDRWLDTLPEGLRRNFAGLFDEMETLGSPEARLWKALDKLEALIQHNEADIATWLPLEYELQMTYGSSECAFDTDIKNLRDLVREDSRKKIEEKNDVQKED